MEVHQASRGNLYRERNLRKHRGSVIFQCSKRLPLASPHSTPIALFGKLWRAADARHFTLEAPRFGFILTPGPFRSVEGNASLLPGSRALISRQTFKCGILPLSLPWSGHLCRTAALKLQLSQQQKNQTNCFMSNFTSLQPPPSAPSEDPKAQRSLFKKHVQRRDPKDRSEPALRQSLGLSLAEVLLSQEGLRAARLLHGGGPQFGRRALFGTRVI